MTVEEFFSKYISKPVKKFYHEYILGETDWLDDTTNDAYQETLADHIQSNENDVI